jgi:hypothetical protein
MYMVYLYRKMGAARRKLGYFVWKGSYGFTGAVGGPRDQSNRAERYKRLEAVMKEKSLGGCTLESINSDIDIAEKWTTARVCGEQIDERWKEHPGWWTLNEVLKKFEEVEKEEAEMNIASEVGEKTNNTEGGSPENPSPGLKSAYQPKGESSYSFSFAESQKKDEERGDMEGGKGKTQEEEGQDKAASKGGKEGAMEGGKGKNGKMQEEGEQDKMTSKGDKNQQGAGENQEKTGEELERQSEEVQYETVEYEKGKTQEDRKEDDKGDQEKKQTTQDSKAKRDLSKIGRAHV